jgi:hypothetical protein
MLRACTQLRLFGPALNRERQGNDREDVTSALA